MFLTTIRDNAASSSKAAQASHIVHISVTASDMDPPLKSGTHISVT